MPSIVDRIKQRKLVQWAVAYLAGAFVALQILDAVAEPLSLSVLAQRVVLVAVVVGFLVTLVLAWYHGEKGQQRVRGTEAVLFVLLLVIGVGTVGVLSERTRAEASHEEGAASRSPAGSSEAERPSGSIAVLAFADMSAAGDQAFFAEGITEEILGLLSRVPGLHVAARTSAFSFKGTSTDVRTIGDRLNVRHVLEGSVRRDGDLVRISAQLVETEDGFEVWSESYTRKLTSVIEIQQDIARVVVSELRPQLSDLPTPAARTESAEAHLHYLRGRYHWHRQNNEAAAASFERAIELDPEFAGAWAGLGASLTVLAAGGGGAQMRARAIQAVERAMALDADLPDALAAKARIDLTFHYDWVAAEQALRHAVDLDPTHIETRHWYSHLLSWTGRFDEALEQARHAVRLDPLSPFMNLNLGVAFRYAGRLGEAVSQIERTLELEPGFSLGWIWLWEARLALEDVEGATDALTEWAKLEGGSPEAARLVGEMIAEHRTTDRPVSYTPNPIDELPLAAPWLRRVRAELGEYQLVLDGLWTAYETRTGDYDVLSIRTSDVYRSLRGAPRFEELVRRIGPD